jgi:hypothetical protein
VTIDDPETQGAEEQRQTIADRKRPGKKRKRDCYWDGRRYSPGGVVKGPDGKTYKCDDGEWVDNIVIEIGQAELDE